MKLPALHPPCAVSKDGVVEGSSRTPNLCSRLLLGEWHVGGSAISPVPDYFNLRGEGRVMLHCIYSTWSLGLYDWDIQYWAGDGKCNQMDVGSAHQRGRGGGKGGDANLGVEPCLWSLYFYLWSIPTWTMGGHDSTCVAQLPADQVIMCSDIHRGRSFLIALDS